MNRYKIIIPIILAAIVLIPANASAINEESNSSENARTNVINVIKSARLEGKRLELCQNRESLMKTTMTRITDRAQVHINSIDVIYNRINDLYNSSKISFDNYNQIKADIELEKQEALNAMNQVKVMDQQFSCSGDNPKSTANEFKIKTASQVKSLVGYKNTVKDFANKIKLALSANITETE